MKTTHIRTASISEYGGITKFRNITVTVSDGLGIKVTGLSDRAIRECLLRVCTAITSCGFSIPGSRIDIEVRAHDASAAARTTQYDLPVAIGILKASGQVKVSPGSRTVFGELALDGTVRYPEGTDQRYRRGDTLKKYISALQEH